MRESELIGAIHGCRSKLCHRYGTMRLSSRTMSMIASDSSSIESTDSVLLSGGDSLSPSRRLEPCSGPTIEAVLGDNVVLFRFWVFLCSVFHLTSEYPALTGRSSSTSMFGFSTGILSPFSFPRLATPSANLILPSPEHSMPFFIHFPHVGSCLSQLILRREHWKQPLRC